MGFKRSPQTFSAKVNAVTIGTGEKAVTIGGENVFPLYSFDAPIENKPKIGVQISDRGYNNAVAGIAEYYKGAENFVDMAKKAALMPGADFLVLSFESANPDAENTSVEEPIDTTGQNETTSDSGTTGGGISGGTTPPANTTT